MGNLINNEGITILAEALVWNKTLKLLNISKNVFQDDGFTNFAKELGKSRL